MQSIWNASKNCVKRYILTCKNIMRDKNNKRLKEYARLLTQARSAAKNATPEWRAIYNRKLKELDKLVAGKAKE